MLTFLAALPILVLLWLTFKARSVRTPDVGTSDPSLALTEIVALDDDLLVGYRDGSGASGQFLVSGETPTPPPGETAR